MKTIKVSEATYRAIAEAAMLPFRSTATRQPDGSWLIPVEHDTYERLLERRLPGETDDDTVARLLHRGRPFNCARKPDDTAAHRGRRYHVAARRTRRASNDRRRQ